MTNVRVKAQILKDDVIAFGPGKADLLAAIEETGSIAAAARAMKMSYRRAWILVSVMNECYRAPLVEMGRGGAARGGAQLTTLGRSTLKRYRALQSALEKIAAAHSKKLTADLVG